MSLTGLGLEKAPQGKWVLMVDPPLEPDALTLDHRWCAEQRCGGNYLACDHMVAVSCHVMMWWQLCEGKMWWQSLNMWGFGDNYCKDMVTKWDSCDGYVKIWWWCCLLVASVSQGRICSDNLTYCHTEKLRIKLFNWPSHSILTPYNARCLAG